MAVAATGAVNRASDGLIKPRPLSLPIKPRPRVPAETRETLLMGRERGNDRRSRFMAGDTGLMFEAVGRTSRA